MLYSVQSTILNINLRFSKLEGSRAPLYHRANSCAYTWDALAWHFKRTRTRGRDKYIRTSQANRTYIFNAKDSWRKSNLIPFDSLSSVLRSYGNIRGIQYLGPSFPHFVNCTADLERSENLYILLLNYNNDLEALTTLLLSPSCYKLKQIFITLADITWISKNCKIIGNNIRDQICNELWKNINFSRKHRRIILKEKLGQRRGSS